MDNTIEQVALPQEGQEPELEINLDDLEDTEALKAELAKEREAKRQILARAKAAEELVKKSRETSKPKETQAPVSTDYKDEVYDLRLDGYSREEAQFIMKNGGRKALEDNNYVKVAIETLREQKKAEQAIPDIDSGKSDIERKYTPEQLEKMPMEELVKILPHA
jgi:hypothetical protein